MILSWRFFFWSGNDLKDRFFIDAWRQEISLFKWLALAAVESKDCANP